MDGLVHDRASHAIKLHHHSCSLCFPLREKRPVQVHLECGSVPVHFVHANFRIFVFRQQDFELQGTRLIFETCLVRLQQSYDLISASWCSLDRDDVRKSCHDGLPRKVRRKFPSTRSHRSTACRTTPSRYSAAAAFSIRAATSPACDRKIAWLPGSSTVSDWARFAMNLSRSGLIIRSCVAMTA